jgi:hypothetical protein
VTIEYSPEVLKNQRSVGVLFGIRQKARLHILAARAGLHDRDPLLAGMDPVGIFVTRSRGEVFLTEQDLESFEDFQVPNAVALVMAGDKGGFFVREPGGAVQAVQSYEEFSAADQTSRESVQPNRHLPIWLCFAAGALALLAFSILVIPYVPVQTPLPLEVRSNDGSLYITWGHDLRTGNLEIMDGDKTSRVPISKGFMQVTYVPLSADVEILLTASDWKGQSRRAIARYLAAEAMPEP